MKVVHLLSGPWSRRAPAVPTQRIVRGGKVLFYPCPNGTVRIVGLSDTDEWIAEFTCRERDFSERYLRRMERHVAEKSGAAISIVG